MIRKDQVLDMDKTSSGSDIYGPDDVIVVLCESSDVAQMTDSVLSELFKDSPKAVMTQTRD